MQKEENRIKEAQGRSLFSAFTITQPEIKSLIFIEDPFSSIDCNFISGSCYVTSEIKTRDYKHDHFYSKKGWVLEKTKYDAMMQGQDPNEPTQERAFYINIFQDAIVVYDLSEMFLTFKWELLREEHTSTKKVWKNVAYLPISQAAQITLI